MIDEAYEARVRSERLFTRAVQSMMCDIAQVRCESQADERISIASDSDSVIENESSEDDWAGAAVWISSSTGDETDADFWRGSEADQRQASVNFAAPREYDPG